MRKIWDKFVSLLYKVPADKWMHFFVGVLVASFSVIALRLDVIAIVPAFFAGFLKEIFDVFTIHKGDWADLAATVLGGLVISFFQLIGHLVENSCICA